MYTLYHFPFSQHARRVVMLLEEAKLPYQLHHVAMDKGEHASDAFQQVNPNGQVPVLVDDGFKLAESNAILRYLCTKHELDSWYPRDPKRRAEVDQWLDWNQCRLAPTVVDIVLHTVFMGPKGDKAAIARGREKLPGLFEILAAQVSEGWLLGSEPTIADLSIASNVSHLGFVKDIELPKRVQVWLARVEKLDGYQHAKLPRL